MKNNFYKYIFFLLFLISGFHCVQPYVPPNIQGTHNYLVVDGTILSGPDQTIINLSRAQNINDSSYYMNNPETGAIVSVVGEAGDSYALSEQSSGTYTASSLSLNPNELYRLKITTQSGEQYQSDSMPVKITPPIDSISWQWLSDGVHIYVNTHDPDNNTHYYRWDYTETWEYNSAFATELIYSAQSNTVVERDPSQYVFTCWKSDQSTDLLLGSSAKLRQDIIYMQPVTLIPQADQKLSVKYSILINQYAMTEGAYQYWQSLQQNTEQLGSIFDPQPSSLTGNIKSITSPNEIVLGYISMATVQQQRIFINSPFGWTYSAEFGCSQFRIPNNPDSLKFFYQGGYEPTTAIISQGSDAVIGYYSAINSCVDCTLQGGTTVKPSFWQ